MMTLGKRLRMVRGDRTIASFVKGYGICPNTLMNYEADRRKPDAEFLTQLCAEEGVDPRWLLGLQDAGGMEIQYQRSMLEMVTVAAFRLNICQIGSRVGKLLPLAYERAVITHAGERQVEAIIRDLLACLDIPEERCPYVRNVN